MDWAEFWKQAGAFVGFWHVPLTVVAIIVGAVVLTITARTPAPKKGAADEPSA